MKDSLSGRGEMRGEEDWARSCTRDARLYCSESHTDVSIPAVRSSARVLRGRALAAARAATTVLATHECDPYSLASRQLRWSLTWPLLSFVQLAALGRDDRALARVFYRVCLSLVRS